MFFTHSRMYWLKKQCKKVYAEAITYKIANKPFISYAAPVHLAIYPRNMVLLQDIKLKKKQSARSPMTPTKLKAIVIEDDQDLQYIYKLKLEREGFDVRTASNGEEGLAVCEAFAPDIILLDLMMPVMNGTEMLAHLRAQNWGSNIRVIILTNISKDEAPQALRFLHVDRYIVKAHHTPAQVVEIVREIVGKPRN